MFYLVIKWAADGRPVIGGRYDSAELQLSEAQKEAKRAAATGDYAVVQILWISISDAPKLVATYE